MRDNMNPVAIAEVINHVDPALWIVTVCSGPQRGGLVATFVNSASIVSSQPRVIAGIAKHHHTWRLIEAAHAFALHLVSEEQLDWVWRFGTQPGRDVDKLDGLAVRTAATGSPILQDAVGWLDCRVEATFDTGDRSLYLASVLEGRLEQSRPALTMKRLMELALPDMKRVLKEQYERDAQIDANAIQRWRQAVL